MGDDLEQALKGKTLADIIHALPCDHPIQVEIDRLKGELEESTILNSEYKIITDAHKRQSKRYENIYRREFEAKQQLKAAESEITELDGALSEVKRQLAEVRSSGYWHERYKSCAEHLHLYTDGEEHGTADSCSFCTVVAEIKGQLTEAQRQLTEATALAKALLDKCKVLDEENDLLKAELEMIKDELFDKDTAKTMSDMKKYVIENFKLKSELKEVRGEIKMSNEITMNLKQAQELVKDLLEAVDKISPDVEGYFEPCNEELCKLRDWIRGGKDE